MNSVSVPSNPVLQLVVFHVDNGKSVVDQTKYGSFRAADYHRMIALMWKSFQLYHPEATLTILTDMNSRFGGVLSYAKILRRELDVSKLMYERMVSQRDCLNHLDSGSPVFLLDSDMLCLNSFNHLFVADSPDFDIALTYRRSHNTPINGGLIIVKQGDEHRKKARHFMDEMISAYDLLASEDKTWFGDQHALRDMIGMHHSNMRNMRVIKVKSADILLLDCAQYNFTPNLDKDKLLERNPTRRLLHFKGALKYYMKPYYWIMRLRARDLHAIISFLPAFLARFEIKRLERLRQRERHTASNRSTSSASRGLPETGPRAQSAKELMSPKTLADHLRSRNLTYCGYDKLSILHSCVSEVEALGLVGRFIEAGVALGGSAIFIAHYKSKARVLELYDVYNQIPPPGPEDGEDAHRRYAEISSGESGGLGEDTYYGYMGDIEQKVAENLESFGFPVGDNNISLVKGLFEDTMVINGPVALAHIDGDWYESVQVCIERIAPHIVPGGYMVFDDYSSYSGCRKAVDQWLEKSPEFNLVAYKRSAAIQRSLKSP